MVTPGHTTAGIIELDQIGKALLETAGQRSGLLAER
jgi:hypothetical protein